MATPLATPLATINVVAPAGVSSGQPFYVIAPSGETLTVPMPADVGPGQIFTCIVPAHVMMQPQMAQPVMEVTAITNIYQLPTVSAVNTQPHDLKKAATQAKLPTPLEMQRIGDQHRQQEQEAAATQPRLPQMEPFFCTCLGELKPTASGSRWELPQEVNICGCITTTEMDLRNQTFAPRSDNRTPDTRLKSCACISNTSLLVPPAPEVSVAKGGCGGCINNVTMNDKRPKELRGTVVPHPKAVVRIGGCACINNTDVTILEHGQPLPKGFFHWFFGGTMHVLALGTPSEVRSAPLLSSTSSRLTAA